MSKGNPVEEGNAEPATSLAETEAAACVGVGTTDDGSGLDAETDEYDELLASLGRTEDDDQRIAVHEAGHASARACSGTRSVARPSILIRTASTAV